MTTQQDQSSLSEFEILKHFGLSKNEIHTYLAVLSMGLCEARQICSETAIPSSKIYNILEKLGELGLIEIQQTRPKKYKPILIPIALDNLKQIKKREYDWFKAQLPHLQIFLQKLNNTTQDNSLFWNVTLSEHEIFNRHISRFRFVEFIAMICIDYNMLEKMTQNSKMANEISLDFKEKKITTKLIIAYHTPEQRSKILKWISQRPRKIDSKNQIRLLNEFIPVPFGLFDLSKVILLMRHPVRPKEEFLLSIYMANKPLYEDLIPYFDDIWNRAENISLNYEKMSV